MIVKFISSETGEMVMMAETARALLKAIGKSCTAEGVLVKSEIPLAVTMLTRYLERLAPEKPEADGEAANTGNAGNAPVARVSLRQRAWPFLKMLNRTAQSRKESHITWKAAADFESGS
jgi:hypothetical protein